MQIGQLEANLTEQLFTRNTPFGSINTSGQVTLRSSVMGFQSIKSYTQLRTFTFYLFS